MSDDDGSDVDTGLRMRDLRANAKALLRNVGKAPSGAPVNPRRYVQLSITADIEFEANSAAVEDIKKQVYLAMSFKSQHQLVPQDTSAVHVQSETSDAPMPQEDHQRKSIELLMEENDLVIRLYNVFKSHGATLVDVRSGSIGFTLQIPNLNRLKSFWKAYKDGNLQLQVQDVLITKDLEQKAGCSLFLRLNMDEKEYSHGLEYFSKQELRLVLVGRTGAGKSTTGNHILLKNIKGQRPFATAIGGSSMTQDCDFSSNEVLERDVFVVDTPGLFDTTRKNIEVLTQLTRFLLLIRPGPHAIILVMRAGKITTEVQKTVEAIVKLFKEGVYGYMIVLFTAKDKIEQNRMTPEEYVDTLPRYVRDIISKCGDRCIAFDNRASDQDNITQVKALLEMIEDMVQKNGGSCYESELHRELAKISKPELTSDAEEFREATKNDKLEPGGWLWKAVAVVATYLGWDM